MVNDPNNPNRLNQGEVNHGARKVDIGPERKGFNWLWLLLIPVLALLAWALWPKHHDEVMTNTTEYNTTNTVETGNSTPAPVDDHTSASNVSEATMTTGDNIAVTNTPSDTTKKANQRELNAVQANSQ